MTTKWVFFVSLGIIFFNGWKIAKYIVKYILRRKKNSLKQENFTCHISFKFVELKTSKLQEKNEIPTCNLSFTDHRIPFPISKSRMVQWVVALMLRFRSGPVKTWPKIRVMLAIHLHFYHQGGLLACLFSAITNDGESSLKKFPISPHQLICI